MSAPEPTQPSYAELEVEIRSLRELVAAQQAVIAELQAQLRDLTERTNRHSGNSSKPPSTDPPWQPRPKKPPSGRKRGGQKGHPGHYRRLVENLSPPDVEWVAPPACGQCGEVFPATDTRGRGRRKFRRWQVVELPPIRPQVQEYRLLAATCARCGRRTWAQLPPGVSRRCVGPRVQAMVALLTGACRLSRRQTQRLLHDLFGLSLSLGTLSALEADTTAALAAPYQEVAAAVPQAAALGVDETSWKRAGLLHWLWTAVTPQFAYYRVERQRNRAAYRALLGETSPRPDTGTGTDPPGPLIHTDRFSVYHHLPPERRSLCWAHLARDFRAAAERGGVDGVVGQWVLELLEKLLEPWQQYRQGTLDRAAMGAAVTARQTALRTPVEWGAEHGSQRTRALCRDVLARWVSLWTWLTVDGGEPTNNSAERALRPAVLWRKSSFGHQSDRGGQFVERLLTVVGTLQRQERNTWDYLVQTCEAAMQGKAAPALLP